MLRHIVEVKSLDGHRLHLRFDNGVEGTVDISALVRFEGVFEPLRDPTHFRQVRVEPTFGAICWPNGAHLDPTVLYCAVTGEPLPNWTEPDWPGEATA